MNDFKKIDWESLSTSTISDALDKLGIGTQCFGIKPLKRSFKVIGQAYTVKYIIKKDKDGNVGDYIEQVPRGSVVVIDNEGRLDCTVWGDLLTRYAKKYKISGTVINGVCRDTTSSLEFDYPIFSKGTYMRTGKDRVQFFKENIPVLLGGTTVNPQDIIVGDADGVVVVPEERSPEVLKVALEIHRSEQEIIKSIEQNISLKVARNMFHYHKLQRNE